MTRRTLDLEGVWHTMTPEEEAIAVSTDPVWTARQLGSAVVTAPRTPAAEAPPAKKPQRLSSLMNLPKEPYRNARYGSSITVDPDFDEA